MACSAGDVRALCSPGCFCSSRTIGKVYTSGIGASGGAAPYESDDNGDTVTVLVKPAINPAYGLCGQIHVPLNGNAEEYIVYHGGYDETNSELFLNRVDADGTTIENISPEYELEPYGPYKSIGTISSNINNQNMMAFCLANADLSKVGAWTSIDGGETMTIIVSPIADSSSGRYERVLMAQDGSNVLFLLGTRGKFAVSKDFGETIEDRTGDIDQDEVGEIIGVIAL